MPPQESPAAENPYAAPQATLTNAKPSAAQRGVRWQFSYLRSAVIKTFYVNLVFILVVILAMFFFVQKERGWNHFFDMILAGSLAVTMACWPIGIVLGCWDMVTRTIFCNCLAGAAPPRFRKRMKLIINEPKP